MIFSVAAHEHGVAHVNGVAKEDLGVHISGAWPTLAQIAGTTPRGCEARRLGGEMLLHRESCLLHSDHHVVGHVKRSYGQLNCLIG